jgi:hypothetical protein
MWGMEMYSGHDKYLLGEAEAYSKCLSPFTAIEGPPYTHPFFCCLYLYRLIATGYDTRTGSFLRDSFTY